MARRQASIKTISVAGIAAPGMGKDALGRLSVVGTDSDFPVFRPPPEDFCATAIEAPDNNIKRIKVRMVRSPFFNLSSDCQIWAVLVSSGRY